MDTDNKQRLKDLLTKRASVKGQITKFKNYISTFASLSELSSIRLTELSLKLAKLEALAVRFDDLQNEIEVLNAESILVEVEEREIIENDIIVNIATAKNLIDLFSKRNEDEKRNSSICDVSCCADRHQEISLKLPQIQIAKFDGAYFRWLEFRDTFENLIHNNERISSINKFHYLNSYLQGEAARIISNLEVSNSNYEEAWKLLCNRYNNKRILINHHLSSLLNIKHLPRESESSLRFLVDHVTKNLRALASLGQPTDKWDVLVIYILSSKLDSNTLLKWEEYRSNIKEDVPTLDQFYKFLINRADVLESLNRDQLDLASKPRLPMRSVPNNSNQREGHKSFTKSFASINNKNDKHKKFIKFKCIVCNEGHRIYDCPTFKAKGVNERMMDVAKYKLCKNCLRQGHSESDCHMGPCKVCSKKHNSLLHFPSSSTNHSVSLNQEEETIVNYSNQSSQNISQVILSTAMIEVMNPVSHRKVKVRALLDCGSQSSFISESLKIRLQLKSNPIDSLKVIGIGNTAASNVVESCNVQFKSMITDFKTSLSCLVINELTGCLPKAPVNIGSLKLPDSIQLADPKFHQPGPIDVLIGADIFWDLLGNEQHSLAGVSNLKLRNTKLGWIVSGSIQSSNKLHCNHAIISNSQSNEADINKLLTKFWDLEEVPKISVMSENDKYCERHFLTHTTRDMTGRFTVRLPLKDTPDCLGDTYQLAKKRFISLEKRLKRNPLFKLEYSKFIKEYAELGHLSGPIDNFNSAPYYYLCHHAVLKQESESTKLRVVFDGSAVSTSGYSLNDILMVGPNVQDSLFCILLRCRQYKYLLTGDIEKMYRQVLLEEEDCNLQLILWREDESQPIKTLKLGTLTYGTASASYLSTRCLWQIGEDQDDSFIKQIIQKDFYVDDLITGSNDPQQLKYILNSVSNALKSGCFNLRKFKSNCPLIFDEVADMNKQDNLTISESSSTLGLGWTPSSDTLHFPLKDFSYNKDQIITKRLIMSNSFKIFDPLGLLSPLVIIPKIMLQKLWQQKLDWDQPVPSEIKDDWFKFTDSLKYISGLQIPRHALGDLPEFVELHSFSDASQSAYGACIYMRSTDSNGNVTVRLLCAKSKVAPLKPTTIPRLELQGALLAAKLTKSVLDSIRYRPGRIVHWCDSSVVLGWINSDVTRLKVFVANRVSEIVELTNRSAWRYVPTDSNPADLISRGVNANHLISKDLWWTGPGFLIKNQFEWPVLRSNDLGSLPEVKAHSVIISEPIINFENYSSLNKLVRLFAYTKRFIFNLRHPRSKRVGVLTVDELRESFHTLCVIAQKQSFPTEYSTLANKNPLNSKSKILPLSPFMDNDNLIRVGGRLQASSCPYDKKHPIILHASHRLTKLYFEREHLRTMHAGPQLLLATVREIVWPVNGRYLARRTVNICVRCRRLRGKTLCPKMGNLPFQRVNSGYPFLSVGLDFAGPFHIINRKGRGSRVIKCYLCIFVCLRYKCIHLEAVSDLTKDAFIMTLRRFIARRGKPTEIFSDNGTNLVAAAKEIGNFIKQSQESLSDFANEQAIHFKFIPAYSPHFGGIWEAGVKSAKHHIKHVMGNSHLTFEEISTLFAQVEAILNSRPLCPLSSSPNDLLPLSPGHFILGRPLTALPTPDLNDCKDHLLKRYERLERIRQHFWKRWQKEYLSELQQRTKWRTDKSRLNVGDLVLLAEDNSPPLQWRLGRVLRLICGPDQTPRIADVHTTRGCVRRSLVRLCPLPTAEELQC